MPPSADDAASTEIPTAIAPPAQATHWRALLIFSDEEERLSHKAGERKPRTTTWPIAEFSIDEMRDRWGDGTFAVQWAIQGEDGRINVFQRDQVVVGVPSHEDDEEEEEAEEEEEEAAARAPRAAPPAPPIAPPMSAFAEAAARPLPPVPAVPAAAVGGASGGIDVAQVVMAQSLSLFQYFAELARHQRAEVRTEAELTLRRYEIDVKDRLERDRMANERTIERERQFYREMKSATAAATTSVDAREISREVEDLISERFEELEDRIAKTLQGSEKSTASQVLDFVKEAAPSLPGLLSAVNGAGAGGSSGAA